MIAHRTRRKSDTPVESARRRSRDGAIQAWPAGDLLEAVDGGLGAIGVGRTEEDSAVRR